jgi:hypothetical protein
MRKLFVGCIQSAYGPNKVKAGERTTKRQRRKAGRMVKILALRKPRG